MAINNSIRGGSGAGRGDNPHSTVMNRFSANTRKAAPEAGTANGSQTSFEVRNTGGLAAGEGAAMVRSKYKESRKAGMSPDDARGAALNSYSYSGATTPNAQQGPDIKMATDYSGKAV